MQWSEFLSYSHNQNGMQQSTNGNELLIRVAQGDEIAFRQQFRQYKDKLYSFILHLSGIATIAGDVLQDVF